MVVTHEVRRIEEQEKEDPSKWNVVFVTLVLSAFCFAAVMLAQSLREHGFHDGGPHISFNETLIKDSEMEKEQTEGRRIALSYASAIIGFTLGMLLGLSFGILCCSNFLNQAGSSASERTPLNPKPVVDEEKHV